MTFSACHSIVVMLGLFSILITTVYVDRNNGVIVRVSEKMYENINTMYRMYAKNDNFTNPKEDIYAVQKNYLVLWHSVLSYLQKRPNAMRKDFSTCEYNNCELSFNISLYNISDAVLFDGRWLPYDKQWRELRKRNGQVWIFAAHESPVVHKSYKKYKASGMSRGLFNWTMSYNKAMDDIYLPYGEIRQRADYIKRDFLSIARNKTKGGLIITSHCNTHSKRLEFLNKLKIHTNVTILGSCGTKWNCGKQFFHDSCFDILNDTYAFYLAFENAICDEYHTEKLFENFNYDILIVTRGGRKGAPDFPKGSVIRTDDFKNVKDLGTYMTKLMASSGMYAKLLEEKSQYYSLSYADVYQNALCDICYKMNHQDKYHKVIPDIFTSSVFDEANYCIKK